MERAYKKLLTEETTIRCIVLVFLGAGINFTIGYPFIVSGMTSLIQSPIETLASTLPQSTALLMTFYIIIGVIYSTSASLAFQPKRIISPLYVQIITATFVPILIMYLIATVPLSRPMDFVTGATIAFVLFLFSLLTFLVVGILQTIVVRYW